jgi:class 3 adenylate cyclase
MLGLRRRGSDREPLLRAVGLGVGLLTCLAIAVTLAAWVVSGPSPQPTGFLQGPLGIAAVAVTGLAYAGVGAFLVRRRARDLLGWVFLGIGVGMAVVLPLDLVMEATIHAFRPVPLATLLLVWGVTSVHLPASGAALVCALLLFPTGRLDWPYGRPTAALAIAGGAMLTGGSAVRAEGMLWYPTLPNPAAAPAALSPVVTLVTLAGLVSLVASLVLVAAGLVWRYRRGDPRHRRQLAWVALGAAVMTGSVALLFVGRYAGAVSGSEGERLAITAALGATVLPLVVLRFTAVTASQGQATQDLTFLFTDLLDSTAMYERIGDAFAFDLVRLHFDTLTTVTRHHRGIIVKTIGDALMARFHDPADAVHAALDMFERLERFNRTNATQLVLKVGIHRGDAIAVVARGRVDYFGQTVNVASRVGAIAAPGELVMTGEVFDAPGVARLLEGRPLRSEPVRLKGVSGAVPVHRVSLAPEPAGVAVAG